MQVYAVDPYAMGSNVPIGVPVQGYPPNQMGIPGQMINMPQGQAMPQFAGIQYVFIQNDPLTELDSCTGVTIRQQPEFYEAITGCETANRYHVFGRCPQGYKYLFKCRENSDFCMRMFCPSEIREFNMEISQVLYNGQNQLFANAFKPLKCSCFCCNRPEIIVNVGDRNVGKIVHLFTCCDPEFDVYDASGMVKYFVNADCCQCGIMCSKNICGKFSNAVFNIYAPGSNNIIGTINKMPAQSFAEFATDADSYEISFPQGISPDDKMLIIALGLMIDYQYFETDGNNKKGRRKRRRRYY